MIATLLTPLSPLWPTLNLVVFLTVDVSFGVHFWRAPSLSLQGQSGAAIQTQYVHIRCSMQKRVEHTRFPYFMASNIIRCLTNKTETLGTSQKTRELFGFAIFSLILNNSSNRRRPRKRTSKKNIFPPKGKIFQKLKNIFFWNILRKILTFQKKLAYFRHVKQWCHSVESTYSRVRNDSTVIVLYGWGELSRRRCCCCCIYI